MVNVTVKYLTDALIIVKADLSPCALRAFLISAYRTRTGAVRALTSGGLSAPRLRSFPIRTQ